MASSSFLGALGDAVSQSGRSSRHRHKKRTRSRSGSRSRSRSRHRSSRSITGGLFGSESNYRKHNSSRGSFFGLGSNTSRSSFFGGSRSSYYKRSPREGFISRCLKQLKRLLRDLQHYAKRHPWKVFFLVVLPLITGGALTALLARFGLRIPPSIERMLGMASHAARGDPFSAVSDVVRMAGGGGSSSSGGFGGGFGRGSAAHIERGYNGGLQWERSRSTSYGREDDGLVGGIRRGVSKMFS